MNFRRLLAAAAAATLTLTLAPATATAGSAPTPTSHDGKAADRSPVVPEETTPEVIQRRDTDTLSLYEQAGLTPSRRVRRLATADLAASGAPIVASAVPGAYDSTGYVIPPGLKSHVDTFCGGTGTDGNRVQVMYVRETDQPDRYAQVAPILRNEMRYIDDAFAVSSAQTGGGKRVRWVHDGSCNLSVLNVVLPDGSITGTHAKTEAALNTAGYLEANRKYLAFADVPMGGLGGSACGQGTLYNDTNPTGNLNDGRYPQMARIDLECWVTDSRYNAAPLHEFLHTLGAVMPAAPHGSAGYHCTDGAEVMCYNDGTATVQAVCPDTLKYDIDCNDDDYFNTNPPAGSYLATHWNTASSPFLETVPQLAAPPTLSVTPSTTSPQTGDVVTFTADVPAGTEVKWSTDVPSCENTGAARTGTTFSIQCFDTFAPTVTASASYPTGYTANTVATPVAYTQGAYPTLAITAPSSSPVGKAFTLSANVANAKSPYTYKWTNRTAGCTISAGATSATMTATCDSSVLNQFGTFSVEATRTADGSTIVDTAGVKITSAGAPAVTIDGPPSVRAGTTATFTAIVENATNPQFAWTSLSNYGSSTSDRVTVTVPATAADGSDTLYLTVTSSTGEKTKVQYTYGIEGALAMTMSGPGRLTSGDTGTFTVTPSRATESITWSSDQADCPLVASTDSTTAQVTCGSAFDGVVKVTAVARSGTESVTRTKSVSVSPQVVTQPLDTTLSLSVSNQGHPSTFRVSLEESTSGKAVPHATVSLEFRPLNGEFQQVKELTLDSTGSGYFQMAVNEGGYYRVAYLGDSTHEPSSSTERRAFVYTRLTNARTSTGLTVTLETGSGKSVASQEVVLQRRLVGTRKWVPVTTCKTDSKGHASIKVNPTRRTDFRWTFSGNPNYRRSTSGLVRLS